MSKSKTAIEQTQALRRRGQSVSKTSWQRRPLHRWAEISKRLRRIHELVPGQPSCNL